MFHLLKAVQKETQEDKERQMSFRYRQPLKCKAPQSLIWVVQDRERDRPPCPC